VPLSQAERIKAWLIEHPEVWVLDLAPDAHDVGHGWEILGFHIPRDPRSPVVHIQRKESVARFFVFRLLWHRRDCGDIDRVTSDEREALAAAAKMAGLPYHREREPDDDGMPPDPVLFTVEYWRARQLPPPDFLLGDLLSTTSRVMLIGPTGIGKSNFCMALSFAAAAGVAFLRWAARRPSKVLYIDGEMSARLHRDRLQEAVQRHGTSPDTLWTVNREDYPDLPPLNTEEGQKFVEWMVERIGGVDLIIFDNIQALLVGSHKEDETWAPVLPWIRTLTARKIGQIWQHHTGHATDHGSGDKTREWQFDTVAIMKAPEAPTAGRLIGFNLSFSKARERTPENRADFEPVTIWLDEHNAWQSSAAPAKQSKPPSPQARKFYDALVNALASVGVRRSEASNHPSVTADQWKQQCQQSGLIDPDEPPNRQRSLMSKYRRELIAAGLVACNGNVVWSPKIRSSERYPGLQQPHREDDT